MKRSCFVSVTIGFMMSLINGCGASGSNSDSLNVLHPDTLVVAPSSDSGLPVIPVYFAVLTRMDGTGNEYFSTAYATGILAEASKLSGNVIEVKLAGMVRVPDDDYDDELQANVFTRYRWAWPVAGFVTVVIPQPYTVDGDGMSDQYGLSQNTAPFFTLRTRNLRRERCRCDGAFGVYAPVGSEGDLREMAAMWLHELGHNMGLMHGGARNPLLLRLTAELAHPFAEGDGFNTDNYYLIDPQFLVQFARKMEKARK